MSAADGQPTLEEVAAAAGVSRATVSRVVNRSPKVSDEAREAVEHAIARLGYVPNRAARSLVTRRSDSVALVVPEPDTLFFSDPFFARIVRGISGALAETEFQLVLISGLAPAGRERLERYLLSGHADGVLLISLHGEDPLPRTLLEAGVPLVQMGRPAGIATSYVDADNEGGAHQAVEYLLERGRRTIATIAGPDDMAAGIDRVAGYRAALAEAGLEADPALVERGDFTQESGERAMAALLERRPGLDAVFAASDLMAAGALPVLAAAGKRVPQDVALVGFDDSVTARLTDPPLTTVRQPIEEMGRELARMLLDQILSRDPGPQTLVLCTELVERGSA
jgi:DNA-binding LacI/PurR family transcriptional regulator